MKKSITHKAKALTIGAVLFGLLMTGCSAHKDDTNPGIQVTPSTTATASEEAPAAPSASPTASSFEPHKNLSQEQFDKLSPELKERLSQEANPEDKARILGQLQNALSVDVDEVLKNRTGEDVLTTLKMDEATAKQGVTSVLKGYRELLSVDEFAHGRVGANDANLIVSLATSEDGEAIYSAELMAEIKDGIKKDGRLTWINTVREDGTINFQGTDYKTDAKSYFASVSGQPTVSVSSVGGNMHIQGFRSFRLYLADGKALVGEREYWIDCNILKDANDVPLKNADGSDVWVIKTLGEGDATAKIQSTDELRLADAKASADALQGS